MSEIQFETTMGFQVQTQRALREIQYSGKMSSYRQASTDIRLAFTRSWKQIPSQYPDQKEEARCELIDTYKKFKSRDAAVPELDKKYSCYRDVRAAFKKYLLENYDDQIGRPGELDPLETDAFFVNELAAITKHILSTQTKDRSHSLEPQQSPMSLAEAVAYFKTMSPIRQQQIFTMWRADADDAPFIDALMFADFVAVTGLHEESTDSPNVEPKRKQRASMDSTHEDTQTFKVEVGETYSVSTYISGVDFERPVSGKYTNENSNSLEITCGDMTIEVFFYPDRVVYKGEEGILMEDFFWASERNYPGEIAKRKDHTIPGYDSTPQKAVRQVVMERRIYMPDSDQYWIAQRAYATDDPDEIVHLIREPDENYSDTPIQRRVYKYRVETDNNDHWYVSTWEWDHDKESFYFLERSLSENEYDARQIVASLQYGSIKWIDVNFVPQAAEVQTQLQSPRSFHNPTDSDDDGLSFDHMKVKKEIGPN